MPVNALYNLVTYAQRTGLIDPCERTWAVNTLLEGLGLNNCPPPPLAEPGEIDLAATLDVLTDDAIARGLLAGDSITYRDRFDTMLMGRLTPRPAQVIERFQSLYTKNHREATDWFYQFCQDTNYIRQDRMIKDVRWVTATEYGDLDITINLAKPEKDPKAIAAARDLPAAAYPRCQLCRENEGYAGRLDHPARGNHRVVPVTIRQSPWFLQYSPYVYYNEHCIVLSEQHTPMQIDRACFEKLLDFVGQFPHYFVGSNADLPIVGGSILAHDHFQGGRYTFAMEKAPVDTLLTFPGFDDVEAGVVRWPLSVLRITSRNPQRLIDLADRILTVWRGHTDESAHVLAETGGEPHNTITPIARMRDGRYELDLVLRNNLTTAEHPLGLYHPHAELHHIKKENIGLIEVMGLAVLPARLKDELAAVANLLVSGGDLRGDERTQKHANWAESFASRYAITPENAGELVRREVGLVFAKVLEHAGVYKRTAEGRAALLRFTEQVK